MSTATFLLNFIRHPRQIGAVAPGSPVLAKTLLAPLDWSKIRQVVECGPGDGALTMAIAKRLSPQAEFLCLEVNQFFIDQLRPRLHSCNNVTVLKADAADLYAVSGKHFAAPGQVDLIVMSLPFSHLSPAKQEMIISNAQRALRPQGQLVIYQYSRYLYKLLQHYFPQITLKKCWLNVPPATIFYCGKGV